MAAAMMATTALSGCGGAEHTLLEEAQDAVRERLRDPASAVFNDQITAVYLERGLVCSGSVNSRNGFGGMTGDQSYYYSRSEGALLEEDGVEHWGELLNLCIEAQRSGDEAYHPSIRQY